MGRVFVFECDACIHGKPRIWSLYVDKGAKKAHFSGVRWTVRKLNIHPIDPDHQAFRVYDGYRLLRDRLFETTMDRQKIEYPSQSNLVIKHFECTMDVQATESRTEGMRVRALETLRAEVYI